MCPAGLVGCTSFEGWICAEICDLGQVLCKCLRPPADLVQFNGERRLLQVVDLLQHTTNALYLGSTLEYYTHLRSAIILSKGRRQCTSPTGSAAGLSLSLTSFLFSKRLSESSTQQPAPHTQSSTINSEHPCIRALNLWLSTSKLHTLVLHTQRESLDDKRFTTNPHALHVTFQQLGWPTGAWS